MSGWAQSLQEQKEVSHPAARAAPLTKFAITMRHRSKEQTTDILLSSPAIEVLALEAMSRDLSITALIGTGFSCSDRQRHDPQDIA
jgi:hypothetical protein